MRGHPVPAGLVPGERRGVEQDHTGVGPQLQHAQRGRRARRPGTHHGDIDGIEKHPSSLPDARPDRRRPPTNARTSSAVQSAHRPRARSTGWTCGPPVLARPAARPSQIAPPVRGELQDSRSRSVSGQNAPDTRLGRSWLRSPLRGARYGIRTPGWRGTAPRTAGPPDRRTAVPRVTARWASRMTNQAGASGGRGLSPPAAWLRAACWRPSGRAGRRWPCRSSPGRCGCGG